MMKALKRIIKAAVQALIATLIFATAIIFFKSSAAQ